MSRRPSIPVGHPHNSEEDLVLSPVQSSFPSNARQTPRVSQTPAIPQTPLVSQHDRQQLDEKHPSGPGGYDSKGTAKLPQKPAARRASNGGAFKPSVDWTRARTTSQSTFLPLGLFSGFTGGGGDARGKYEGVEPMKGQYGAGGEEKNYIELDMDDYSEGLRLSAGLPGQQEEDGSKSRRASAMGAFFDQFYPREIRRNRRTWERLAAGGAVLTLLLFLLFGRSSGGGAGGSSTRAGSFVEKAKVKGLGPKNPLKSNIPLHSFRANLKEGHGYVTSFPYGGLTNQLIELFKLVHVAQRLDRDAILTELKATHSEGSDVPLSDFFDLSSFSYYSNVSMVRWQDVKIPDITGTQQEVLSCWGWRDERPLERYNIKTHFWPFPGQLQVPSSIETSITFPGIEVLSSQDNTPWLTETANRFFAGVENAPPFPDKQLMCFENLFYVPSVKFVEGQMDTSYTIEELRPDGPVWARVGQYLRFNDHVNHVTDEFMTALLGSRRKQFIGVHIRQGDFVALGRASKAYDEVIDMYSAGVRQVEAELRKRRNAPKGRINVVFTTDSDDPSFIHKVQKLKGWVYADHQGFQTASRFGGWWPGVLDSSLLSRAIGFVGTKQSTFSYVASRRVESWNSGVTTIVG
ncbi:hypothetical protein JCM8547_005151 [Rhodosporidiobolus lusitaniae]